MKEIIRKTFLLGLGAASMTKDQAEKVVKDLVKKNAVTIKESRNMLRKIRKATDVERKRISKFASQEASRVTGKMGVISKAQLAKVKKRLNSIDRELSSRGKKTLKSVLKQFSK